VSTGGPQSQPGYPGPVVAVPSSHSLRDADVSARLAFRPDELAWDVSVLLSRRPDLPQVEADELTTRLLDPVGSPLPVLSQPSGRLVEVGGGLGVTANAEYRFAAPTSGEAPSRLEVEYRGESAGFDLVPATAGSPPVEEEPADAV
jgi:hypothetical protein